MSMEQAIRDFARQLEFEPVIENESALRRAKRMIVCGMGGSNLATGLWAMNNTREDIHAHRDYGLPILPAGELEASFIIANSYSGNTEEPVDAFKQAKEKDLSMAVIATGGELLKLAIENKIPYIQLPDTGIQPRSALGFSVKAFLKLIGEEDELKKISKLAETLNPIAYEEKGKALAETIKGYIPVIYTSTRNFSIAYNWKIKFNETGKIPAFYNLVPELNHNEMTGFDVKDSTWELSGKFHFFVLKDNEDDPRILKRMEVLEKLYKDRNLKVETIDLDALSGRGDKWHKVFSALLLADWAAYHTALLYGLEPEQVPMVEEFKKIIAP